MKRILPFLLILISSPFFGQTYQTWRSEATNNIWQTNDNWWNFPNGSPIVFGQQEWDNNHQTSQQSTSDVSTWRFLFKGGANAAHTFSGNKVRFFDFTTQNPSITNTSTATHVINNNIEGDGDVADPLEIYVYDGNLTFNGTMNNMGSWIDVYGNSGRSVAFTGAISGNGGFTVKQNVTVTLSNATNSYTGSTTVESGTLIVQKGGHSANITTGAIAFTFASTTQAAGTYDFLPGQLGGNTSRTLTSNLVGSKSVSFNYATGDVTICDLSTAPTGILGNTSICAGSSTSLTVNGGTKGTGAVTQWYTGSCGGTLVGTGDTLNTTSLLADTIYYVRYSGNCNTTTCAQVTVTVTPLATPTVSLSSSDGDNTFAYGTSVTFTANAGNLGGGTASYDFKVNGVSVQNGASNTYTVSTANENNLANGNQVSVSITVTGGTCLS
uniref:immunoglobulin domain-containing protein n=1 Tax=Flavobacterium sp. UBA7682 TaxID=1946560 RepID=UPI0025C68B39